MPVSIDSSPPIDVASFESALNAGAFDSCLSYLAESPQFGQLEATLCCRLAEALFHNGREDTAVDCCRAAVGFVQLDAQMLNICAWIFSNAAQFEDAAAVYLRRVELEPSWTQGYRHASAMLLAAGRRKEALATAIEASDAEPANLEFALHAARLLSAAGSELEASSYIDRATSADLHNDFVIDAAELLMQIGRPQEATRLLRGLATTQAEPRLDRVLSSAEMLCEQWEAALVVIDRAIAAAPGVAEYHVHRAHLLRHLGRLSEAAQALDLATGLDPNNGDAKHAQLSFYLSSGMATEATVVGGELLHRFPDDRRAAESVLHLLNHRLDTIDGDFVVLPDGARRQSHVTRPPPDWADRLRAQFRVIGALIIRETRTRFGDSKLGYGWALIEPILHIALLSATFSVLMHGQPPIGEHFFLFYYTGLIPYHVFVHSSGGMSHAIVGNGPLLELPLVTTFDVIAARGLLEVATDITVAILLLLGFGAIGINAIPDDLLSPSLALLVTALLGCGVGFLNAVFTVVFRSWEKAFGHITRLLYFISGIFYVPGMMPDWTREILSWNPLLHAIDWFRAGFFGVYQPHWLDRSYLAIVAALALMAGFGIERGFRRRLSVPL